MQRHATSDFRLRRLRHRKRSENATEESFCGDLYGYRSHRRFGQLQRRSGRQPATGLGRKFRRQGAWERHLFADVQTDDSDGRARPEGPNNRQKAKRIVRGRRERRMPSCDVSHRTLGS